MGCCLNIFKRAGVSPSHGTKDRGTHSSSGLSSNKKKNGRNEDYLDFSDLRGTTMLLDNPNGNGNIRSTARKSGA